MRDAGPAAVECLTIVYVALCRDAGWEPCPHPYAGWLPLAVSHKISQIAFITAHIGSDSFPNVHMRAFHLRLTVDVAVAVAAGPKR